jgi:hypothetical protein
MDIGRAFGYVFDDDRWIIKLLIAAAILALGFLFFWLVIPIFLAAFLLNGYGIEITRRVINRDPDVLPEWDNWGQLLIDGVKMFVIELVYALPIILVGVCLGPMIGVFAENAEEVSGVLSAIMSCLNLLWAIVLGLLLPAAIAFFVANDDLSAAFRFGDIFGFVRDNFATYLIVLLIGWVASIIGGLGLLVCGVGILVTGPYSGWITSHLAGQAYLEGRGQAVQPILEEEPVEAQPEEEASEEEDA